MKRKVDQDFSISSSATKIRRLDADLPPIEEPEVAQQPPIIPEVPSPASENQERALVLFKPVNHSPLFSPSSFSFTVDSDIVSAINTDQRPWSRQYVEEEAICRDENNRDRLALVPWAPSQFQSAPGAQDSNTELMEADQMEEEASMEVEEQDYSNSSIHPTATMHCELTETEGLQPWQQQHCLIPQLPQNTSTPISWTR
ncbi:uncharacterized protein LOC114746047 isoform X1 [Neltuma alba]|uniref:uncharacterized protein LOC114746047 isoform X1 n=1 Tax=Neltuma alba TaxID=207710 RepID=UPI0010A452D6|nr:uncharacterized protein LOC114746047 isoform X1 [Prosopis alba]